MRKKREKTRGLEKENERSKRKTRIRRHEEE